METIKDVKQIDLINLVQLKLPGLYKDFGQEKSFTHEDANYISERVAIICASDYKIRQCDVSIIGKAFDRLVSKPISDKVNTLFKISPKMIVSEISAIATEIENDKRIGFEVSRNAEEAKNRNFFRGSCSTPVSLAVVWKISKRCDGYILDKKAFDDLLGKEVTVELISLQEVARCFEEKLNPDNVFRSILDSCEKNPNMFKGRLTHKF